MLSPLVETQRKTSASFSHPYHPTSRKPPALQVVSSYSSFVPNQIFDECRPFEALTYAAVQYLSFHSIKCSARNLAKNVNLSGKVIKNALCLLRKRRFIVKRDDGTYLFKKLNPGHSTELVDAREVARPEVHLGYWFPVDILKSKRINNQAKRAFALILSLTKTGVNQIKMDYIAQKLNLSRYSASPLIGRLLDERLITRHRNHCRSVYFYQIGEKAMSIYKKDLSTVRGHNRVNYTQPPPKGHPDDTSKGHPDDTSFSIKESNISIRDKSKSKRGSDTCKVGKNKNIIFWKEEEKKLNVQYTKACNDGNYERMKDLRVELAMVALNLQS